MLRIDTGGRRIATLKLADSATVGVGDAAYAIGNPYGLDHTFTTGIVSALGREIQAPDGATIDGVETTAEGPALKARVRAVPENGAANAAVCELVARAAGVAKRSVALTHGGKSRVKVLMIEGDPVEIVRRLEALAVDAGKAGGKR